MPSLGHPERSVFHSTLPRGERDEHVLGCETRSAQGAHPERADRCLEFFAECGYKTGDIVLKTDQENAIKFLVKDLVAERGSEPGHKA